MHRNVKLSNFFVDQDAEGRPRVRVSDFGIARPWDTDSGLTLPGTAIGTPTYMSPEQMLTPSSVDQQADVWSSAPAPVGQAHALSPDCRPGPSARRPCVRLARLSGNCWQP